MITKPSTVSLVLMCNHNILMFLLLFELCLLFLYALPNNSISNIYCVEQNVQVMYMYSEMRITPALRERKLVFVRLCLFFLLDIALLLIHEVSFFYYMASSASGQDEPIWALWLATQVGKMELSCLLGTTCHVPQEKFCKSQIINVYWPSFFSQDGWILTSFFFFASLWTSTPSRSINMQKKKKELGQYPAILTSHLVNNPYILWSCYVTQGAPAAGISGPCVNCRTQSSQLHATQKGNMCSACYQFLRYWRKNDILICLELTRRKQLFISSSHLFRPSGGLPHKKRSNAHHIF